MAELLFVLFCVFRGLKSYSKIREIVVFRLDSILISNV